MCSGHIPRQMCLHCSTHCTAANRPESQKNTIHAKSLCLVYAYKCNTHAMFVWSVNALIDLITQSTFKGAVHVRFLQWDVKCGWITHHREEASHKKFVFSSCVWPDAEHVKHRGRKEFPICTQSKFVWQIYNTCWIMWVMGCVCVFVCVCVRADTQSWLVTLGAKNSLKGISIVFWQFDVLQNETVCYF